MLVEQYITAVEIEAEVILNLTDQSVLPAAIAERTAVAGDAAALKAVLGACTPEDLAHLQSFSDKIANLRAAKAALTAACEASHAMEEAAKAAHCAENIVPGIDTLRTACDAIEQQVADIRWTLPKYSEMLFHN